MAKTARWQGGAKAARRSAAEWATEVAAWKRSGDTSREYARARGISAATLLWWSCRGSAHGSAPRVTGASAGRELRGFLPVRVVAQAEDAQRFEAEIVLAGGRRVRVAGALTLKQLGRLLQVVEGGSAC